MKNKKLLWAILIPIIVIIGIYLIVALAMPKGLGPIEPFLNLGELFKRSDGTTPGKPAYYQKLYDCSTGESVTPGEPIQPGSGCDDWSANRFERPFNADTQDEYYPELDIQQAYFGRDADWYYLRFALFDPQPEANYLAGTYAIEMDLDGDGRGDLLVLVSEPGKETGKKWSTQGVQIWEDANNDVGAENPNAPESEVASDGYDTLLFDQGNGDDPNGAWARAFMSGSAYVELAFKAAYLDGDLAFKWWIWSSYGTYSPDMFELHDFYTHEQAGDPYEGSDFFPTNEISAIDSTCAKMWGAGPNPADPDFCSAEDEPEFQQCCILRLLCLCPRLCRVPVDIPGPGDKPGSGDDTCVLAFEDWFIYIWIPAHPGDPIPSQGESWLLYNDYLLDPYCPQEDFPTPTPTPTITPTTAPTNTPTITPTMTPTPTKYSPPPPSACQPSLNKADCLAAGGKWNAGAPAPPGGAPIPPSCECK